MSPNIVFGDDFCQEIQHTHLQIPNSVLHSLITFHLQMETDLEMKYGPTYLGSYLIPYAHPHWLCRMNFTHKQANKTFFLQWRWNFKARGLQFSV